MNNYARSTFLLCCGLLAVPGGGAAQDSETTERSINSGVYTEEQATRGEQLFEAVCSECHEAEEFTDSFMESWMGADVAELYDVVFSTMPEDMPGSLRPQEYADALAYIFQLNGIPTGATELKPDMALLRYIIIDRTEPAIRRGGAKHQPRE